MTHSAEIWIVCADQTRAAAVSGELGMEGFSANTVSNVAEAIDGWRGSAARVLLLGSMGSDEETLAAARTFRESVAGTDLAILLFDTSCRPELCHGAAEIGVFDIVSTGAPASEIAARLPGLMRSAVMRTALHERVEVARRFGVDVDPTEFTRPYPERPKVLMIAEPDSDSYPQSFLLKEAGYDTGEEENPFRAAERLSDERFDAAVVVLERGSTIGPSLNFCGHIRNNPRLFNLPVVVLAKPGMNIDREGFFRRGACAVMVPDSQWDLSAYLEVLVGRQRATWTLRDPFRATLTEGTADPLTGRVYSHEFMRRYLDRTNDSTKRSADAGSAALAWLELGNLADIRTEFGDAAASRVVRQAADWIIGLTRVEDLVALVGAGSPGENAGSAVGGGFAVHMPNTEVADARVVINRIAGILQQSEFVLGEEIMQPARIWMECGAIGIDPDADATQLLNAARKAAL